MRPRARVAIAALAMAMQRIRFGQEAGASTRCAAGSPP